MSSSTILRQLPITHQCRRAAIARYYASASPASSLSATSGSSLASRRTSESSSSRHLGTLQKTQLWTKRSFSTTTARKSGTTHPEPLGVNLTDGEETIFKKLTERFNPGQLKVQDVSGGCGTFYGIMISSKEFAGKTIVQQHKLVQETIKEEIEGIHGLQIKTIPE